MGEAAIATDLDGVITYWNAAAERLYVAGRRGRRPERVHARPPMAREQARRSGATARRPRLVGRLHRSAPRRRGFPALVTDAPVQDAAGQVVGVVELSSDISDRGARRGGIAGEGEARCRMLAEQGSDIARLAPDGALLDVSPAVERVLGYPPEAMLTPLAKDLLHPDDRPVIHAMFAAIDAGSGAETMTLRMRHRDGEYRWHRCSLRAVRHRRPGR
ncbi:MAG: PAS domain S-box protein [Dehalococcoidia bacterium]